MRCAALAGVLVVLSAWAAPRAAAAQAYPLGSKAWVFTEDAFDSVPPPPPAEPPRRILYLNRHGGQYTFSPVNDSAANESSIAWCNGGMSACVVDGWGIPDETWNAVMSCSRLLWGPYNIEVTDVDPGDVDHIEAVVAGDPEDVGLSDRTLGVAPVTCSVPVIERSIVYVFVNNLGTPNAQRVCEVIGQEAAHSMGLDHELRCDDPMTYLSGCSPKVFQDVPAKCHDMNIEESICRCTGQPTQNSHQMLLTNLGPAETEAPLVTITSPGAGSNVTPGFTLVASATDNYHVTKIDLHVDGTFVYSYDGAATEMVVPRTVAVGTHEFELRAYDPGANIGTASLMLTVDAECSGSGPSTCGAGRECKDGVCFSAFGEACANSVECASGSCTILDSGDGICSTRCEVGGSDCPGGYTCTGTPGSPVAYCEPGGGGGGGCAAGGGAGGSAAAGLGAALAVLLAARRRRRG